MPSKSSADAAPVADLIRADVEEEILAGRLAPGSKINADELARVRGVSHIPVREALRALEADGWVVRRHHRGMFVREHDRDEMADLFEARLIVEHQATRLAAQRRTSDQLADLDEIVARQAAAEDPAILAAINAEFHIAMASCAHNAVLSSMVTDLNKRVRFFYLPAAEDRRGDSLSEHRAILAAIRDRRPDDAAELLAEHIRDTRDDTSRRLGTPAPEPAASRPAVIAG